MTQPAVFISYSHEDEAEKDRLVKHLGVLQHEGLIEVWVDDRIGAGSDWKAEIEIAMTDAKVAILLITANFLTSKFILGTEVPRLLRRRQDEGLTVFPIIAKPCAWHKVDWLARMNVRPKNGAPVWREAGIYADEELATIAGEVADLIDEARQPPTLPQASVMSTSLTSPSHDSQARPQAAEPPRSGTDATVSSPGDLISNRNISSLSQALERRMLVLFIGADLPREVTGLPSRAELARELARRKGLDESLSLAEVSQRVSQAGNRWEFTDFLRNELDTVGRSPQNFHERVATLVKTRQLETLVTTAYDNLLELAFQQAGVGLNRVVRSSEVSFINRDRPTLIKLYGDASQPDTLVVTEQDHTKLLRDRDKEELVNEVKHAMSRNTVLFLGYNLADPDFHFLFDQIAESRFTRTAYAAWPGLPQTEVHMWRDRGIVILDNDPLAELL